MKALQRFLLLILLILLPTAAGAAETTLLLKHRPKEATVDKRFEYFTELLALVLEKTRAEYGDFTIAPAGFNFTQDRAIQLLAEGKHVNIVWSMTNEGREHKTRPIRIPLLKGLLGHRVLLVKEERLAEFAKVTSLKDLARFLGIQGQAWTDTIILKENGLNLHTINDYVTMFKMLGAGRVDYFPRSVAEVWPEVETFNRLKLVVAPNILLVYRAPVYFFVNKNDSKLAERITLGLQRAIADGSFDKLFYSREEIRAGLDFLRQGGYQIIRLKNPELTPETPVEAPNLWLPLPPPTTGAEGG